MDISVVDTFQESLVPRPSDPRTPPLRPPVFHILLALAGQDLHGLGIADEVENASGGALELGPATLYRSLAELSDHGLVTVLPKGPPGADPRRKYYRITEPGRELVTTEATRLAGVLEVARARSVLPRGT
ncbi:MAG: PadR family transcriptional regulator [Gemmatimonadetes bacterium]|nr:PadR family transcriptional regulator [Gemmatimonadota bacterium]